MNLKQERKFLKNQVLDLLNVCKQQSYVVGSPAIFRFMLAFVFPDSSTVPLIPSEVLLPGLEGNM